MSSAENAETIKEARIKLLFALDDMVKNNLEEFWADNPRASQASRNSIDLYLR